MAVVMVTWPIFTSPSERMRSVAISVCVCLSVRSHISKPPVRASRNFICIPVICNMYYRFCGRRHVYTLYDIWVYGEAYGWRMSFSGGQHGEGQSFSALAPPLFALPSADWHPLAISIAVHNGVWRCRQTVRYARGQSLLSSIGFYFGGPSIALDQMKLGTSKFVRRLNVGTTSKRKIDYSLMGVFRITRPF